MSHPSNRLRNIWAQQPNQRNHFFHVVFKRRTCHEKQALSVQAELRHVARTTRAGIFDIMRLIHHQKGKAKTVLKVKMLHSFKRGYRNTAFFQPRRQRCFPFRTVDFLYTKPTFRCYLTTPIGNNTRRANDNKMRCLRILERNYRCDSLDSFAETHFITQQNFPLMEYVFDTPLLIAP